MVYDRIKDILKSQQPELYSRIKAKSVEELGLSVVEGDVLIGFTKPSERFFFWIKNRYGRPYFCMQMKLISPNTQKILRIELKEENAKKIFNLIDTAYPTYTFFVENGLFEKEKQGKEARREARRTAAEKLAVVGLPQSAWTDLTAWVSERLEVGVCVDFCYDEEKKEKLRICAEQMLECFERILDVMSEKHYRKLSRRLNMYRSYIKSDKTTLARVADEYGVSRETVRLTVNKVSECGLQYFKEAMVLGIDELNSLSERAITLFEDIDNDVAGLLCYGFEGISRRNKKAIFDMFFGVELSARLVDMSDRLCELARSETAEKEKRERKEQIKSKICYPSSIKVATHIETGKDEKAREHNFGDFIKKLKRIDQDIEIIETPDIVYYSSSTVDYRPDLLLRMPDGTSALVLIHGTLNMALGYNIKRFNELHRFCKENGYGYLITDPQGRSIYDIRSKELAPEPVEILNDILDKQLCIVWRNIQDIKQMYEFSQVDIAAYILQNRLYFTLKPFCIKRREG